MINDFLHNQATGGSGTLTLTAVSNEPGFSHGFPASSIDRWVRYTIKGSIKKESGLGKVHNSSGTYTLIRSLPQITWDGSYYDDTTPSAVDFTGETVDIYCSPSAGNLKSSLPYEYTRLPSGGIKGRWPQSGSGGGVSSLSLNSSYRYFTPLSWETPGVVDRLSFHTGTNSATAFRCAIYEVDTNGAPGRILQDFGATAVSGTGIKHSTAITPFFLPSGEYIIGIQADASMSVSGSQYNPPSCWFGINSSGVPVTHLARAVSYGAFTDETGGTFTDNTGTVGAIIPNKS